MARSVDKAHSHKPGGTASRRAFLAGAAGLSGAVAGASLSRTATAQPGEEPSRTYGQLSSVLSFDGGKSTDVLRASEGGFAVRELEYEPQDEFAPVRKQLGGQVSYQPLRLTFGANQSNHFNSWWSSALDGGGASRNGRLYATDASRVVADELKFRDAVVTEVRFPAIDAATRDYVYFELLAQPAEVSHAGGGGQAPFAASPKPTPILSNAFRFVVDGLETSSAAISHVDAFSVTQQLRTTDDAKANYLAECSNIVLTLPARSAGQFFEWHERMVVLGSNEERAGTLDYVSPYSGSTLVGLAFGNLGIYTLTLLTGAAYTVRVELYCEQVTLTTPAVSNPPGE